MIYDLIVDLIKHFSISLEILKPYATLFGVIVLLLRQNNIKKMINGHLPKKFRDTQSNDIYDIMRDVKAIKVHLGVKDWENTQQNGQKIIPILSYKRFFLFLLKAKIRRRKKLMEKLKSRKFWLTIVAALIPVINAEFNIHLDWPTMVLMASTIMGGVAALAHVDAKKVLAGILNTKVTVKGIETAFTTFQEAIPYLKEIHADINNLLEDVKKNDDSQAWHDAMNAYAQIKPILDALKHPEPVAVIVEQVSA